MSGGADQMEYDSESDTISVGETSARTTDLYSGRSESVSGHDL